MSRAAHVPHPNFLFSTRRPASTISPVTRDLMAVIDASGMSGKKLAKLAGTTNVTISRWRHGLASPRIIDFECLAETLGYRLELVPVEKGSQS